MLHLPPQTHPARELFDVAQLAELADINKRAQLPTLTQAKAQARTAFVDTDGLRSIHFLVLSADDTLKLVRFGPRGGRKNLWSFGKFH